MKVISSSHRSLLLDIPPTHSHTVPSPLQGGGSPSLQTSCEQTLDIESMHDEQAGDPVYTHSRLPDALMDEFNEGFQQVNAIFSKLRESRGMPWQQVRD